MQHKINLNGKTLLFVGLPKEAREIRVNEDCLYVDIRKGLNELISLPYVDIELIGVYPELTEEMANQVVERIFFAEAKPHKYYTDYRDETYYCDTPLESFQSLMEREKLWTVNPLPYPRFHEHSNLELHGLNLDNWQQAQQRTFSKWAVLIQR